LADYERALPRSYDKATYGLERMRHLVRELGDPQLAYPTIQVGGTNGKGSVCAFAESILRHAGLRTGLTTSPHLLDLRERIRVAGRICDDDLFAFSVADVAEAARRLPSDESATLTFFEAITAAAFVAFRRAAVDVALVEVGLGGRFDATSVTDPSVVVVTAIGHDHQAFLGSTLEEIASDKAHLVRSDEPLVLGCGEALAPIFETRARSFGATSRLLARDFPPLTGVPLGLAGAFQEDNAACAVEAVRASFPGLGDDAIRAGLEAARWPGRYQVVPGCPVVVLDSAMNVESAAALGRELAGQSGGEELRPQAYPPLPPPQAGGGDAGEVAAPDPLAGRGGEGSSYAAPVAIVLGMSHDKDPLAFARALLTALGGRARLWLCAAATPRSLPVSRLAAVLREGGIEGNVTDGVASALALARGSGAEAVCVTGSAYVVGEAMDALGLSAEIV
jgi:dihydrofolate synthase/folylpolyglutamate synthase